MSLRINQNMSALTAHRFMQANDANMGKSIEKLSSGLRINTAADDAAGLVASEIMRTQISGLAQASRNTQDGINMIKTAEGALDETEKQLRNIRDLTLHANNNKGNDKLIAADQAQINQALESINRIADQTQFGGKKLLGADGNNIGGTTGTTFQIGANAGETATFSTAANAADMHTNHMGLTSSAGTFASATSSMAYAATAATTVETFTVNWDHADGSSDSFTFTVSSAGAANAGAYATEINSALGNVAYTDADDGAVNNLDDVILASNDGGSVNFTLKNVTANADEYSAASQLTVYSSSNDGKGAKFGLAGVSDTGSTTTIDLAGELATGTIDNLLNNIDGALDKVNDLRVNLGAFQKNNLESNLTSLAVAKENTQASESTIRDVDMADEMVNFTKSQILTQAAQSMMTQANQAPQSILSMLR